MLRASRKFPRVSNFVAAGSWELGSTCQIFNVAAGTKKLRRQSNFKKLQKLGVVSNFRAQVKRIWNFDFKLNFWYTIYRKWGEDKMLDDFLCEAQCDELTPEWDVAELENMEIWKNPKIVLYYI